MKTKKVEYQTGLIMDTHHDQKNSALFVVREPSNGMVKAPIVNNDSDATLAKKLTFEKIRLTRNTINDVGSNFGSQNNIQFASFPIYRDTAHQSSRESKIIGWSNYLLNWITSNHSSTSPLTAPISTKMGAW